jgi:hypothetical protein
MLSKDAYGALQVLALKSDYEVHFDVKSSNREE